MSFYWYDLETFGQDPRRTRIAQFAGSARRRRPQSHWRAACSPHCKLAFDLLPSPWKPPSSRASPPQHAVAVRAFPKPNRSVTVLEEFTVPQTCVVGYNSLRFDDEFIRYTLYRNFLDPYER